MPTPVRKPLPKAAFERVIGTYSADIGATLSYSGVRPTVLADADINPRSRDRNRHVGYTFTHPDANTLVFGDAYFDRKDAAYNEDFFVIDLLSPHWIWCYYGRSWEQMKPAYRGTHRGDKSYLDQLVAPTLA